jgi:hypothetical protein
MTAPPAAARRWSRLVARIYGATGRDGQVDAFIEDAIAHAWQARRWRGVASVAALLARDLLRVWTRRAALPISAGPPAASPGGEPHQFSRSPMIDRLLTDLRHARRALLRSPGFAAVAVLTLALGIGASTAVYAVVDGAILRPFPYPDMRAIALLTEINRGNGQSMSVSWPNFLDWRRRNDAFLELGVYRGLTLNMSAARRRSA